MAKLPGKLVIAAYLDKQRATLVMIRREGNLYTVYENGAPVEYGLSATEAYRVALRMGYVPDSKKSSHRGLRN